MQPIHKNKNNYYIIDTTGKYIDVKKIDKGLGRHEWAIWKIINNKIVRIPLLINL